MMGWVNDALQYRHNLHDISPFSTFPYLYSCFIISFKFLFEKSFSIKEFSNLINPDVKKLVENKKLILFLLKYHLHSSEL
jgi:hypothetical protein